jgi:hypothetical protein
MMPQTTQATIHVYRNKNGSKRVNPPVGVITRGGVVRFSNVDSLSSIVDIRFFEDEAFFTYNATAKTVTVDPATPPGYYEYEIKLETSLRDPVRGTMVTIVETAEGNSRPGLIVEA